MSASSSPLWVSKQLVRWQHELLLIILVAMQALWLAPWASLLAGTLADPVPRPSALGLGALLWAALMLTRLLEASRLPLRAQQVGLGLLTIASGLFLIGCSLYPAHPLVGGWLRLWLADALQVQGKGPGGLVLLCVALYISWRGMTLAQHRLSLTAVGRSLRLGIIAWLGLYLIGVPVSRAPVEWLFAFFALGLLAIGLARVEELQEEPGAVRSPFAASWLLVLAGAAVGAVGVGLALSALFLSSLLAGVARALAPVGGVVQGIVYAVLSLIGVVLSPLLDLLVRALEPMAQQLAAMPTPVVASTPVAPGAPNPIGAALQVLLWPLAAGLGFLALVALIALGVRRRPARGEDVRAYEATWEAEWKAGAGPGGPTRQRLRDRLGAAVAVVLGASRSLATVRQIYAALLRWAAQRGLPRAEAETPFEYQRRLAEAWPALASEMAALTAAYVRAHYGERAPAPGEVEALRKKWKRIEDQYTTKMNHTWRGPESGEDGEGDRG